MKYLSGLLPVLKVNHSRFYLPGEPLSVIEDTTPERGNSRREIVDAYRTHLLINE
ncbi:hypothetical protein GCM10010407_06660 [Rarobacter incanus]